MAPIRKGDGTGLAGEGYSQVRKGDGTVLWNAIPDSEIDRFEWGGPVSDRYVGDTGSFSIDQNSPVFEGDYSLKGDADFKGESITSYPTDGLDNYPTRGDWIRYYFQLETGSSDERPMFIFFIESGTNLGDWNGYGVQYDEGAADLALHRFDGDSFNVINSVSLSLPSATWHFVDVFSDSNDILVEVFESGDDRTVDDPLASVSATDNTYSGEGVGWYQRDNDVVYDDSNLKQDYGMP